MSVNIFVGNRHQNRIIADEKNAEKLNDNRQKANEEEKINMRRRRSSSDKHRRNAGVISSFNIFRIREKEGEGQ